MYLTLPAPRDKEVCRESNLVRQMEKKMKKYIPIPAILLMFFYSGCTKEKPKYDNPASKEFLRKHSEMIKKHNHGIKFKLSTEKKNYNMGERIEVTMTFDKPPEIDWGVETRTYDRSGRMPEIEFIADGAEKGWEDPLASYFVLGHMGGGLGGGDTPEKHYSRKETMNDWLIFRKPGKYYVYCSTSLVNPISKKPEDNSGFPKNIVSNIIELNIYPTTKNIQRKMEELGFAKLGSNDSKKIREGFEELRYLASKRVVDKIINEMNYINALWILISYKDWDYVKGKLLSGLDDPKIKITPIYRDALEHFALPKEEYLKLVDLPEDKMEVSYLYEDFQDKRAKAVDKLWQKIKMHPRLRDQKPLKISSRSWAQGPDQEFDFKDELIRIIKFELSSRIEKKFSTQEIKRWDTLHKSKKFQEFLKEMVIRYEISGKIVGVREDEYMIAKLFLAKDNPEEVKKILIEDMLLPKPTLRDKFLLSLPKQEIPEIQDHLKKILTQENYSGAFNELIERYGSKDLLDLVKTRIAKAGKQEKMKNAYDTGYSVGPLLRYYIKLDRKGGLAATKKFFSETKNYGWGNDLWKVCQPFYDSEVEDFLIECLNEFSAKNEQGKIFYTIMGLIENGSDKCITPVLQAIAKSHDYCANRANTNKNDSWMKTKHWWYMNRLLMNKRWQFNKKQQEMILNMELTPFGRKKFKEKFAHSQNK